MDRFIKRALVIVLAITLCMSLFACNNAGNTSQPQTSEAGTGEAQTSQQESAPQDEAGEPSALPDEIKVEPQDDALRFAALKGPTAMGLANLINAQTGDYDWTIAASADEITPKLVQGDIDVAAVPANLASVLYNNTNGAVQVLTINTLGVLYIVENGDNIHSVADLRGKTIYSAGKGSTPEYALNYMLTQNGLDPASDVTIEWKSEHAECVSALAADATAVAMLPQPFVTTAMMKNESIRVCLDLNKEWEDAADATLITGVAVVRKEYAEKNPEKIEQFLTSYELSVDLANSDIDATAAAIGALDIVPEPVAKKALPECHIVCITGEEMKTKLSSYLGTLYEQNPKAVGGQLPGDDFYYLG